MQRSSYREQGSRKLFRLVHGLGEKMDLIILNDGLYSLVPVTKALLKDIILVHDIVDCFDLCDIVRLKLTVYYDYPINAHTMKDGSGDFFGCICK